MDSMWMAELAARSGYTVPTIKFYLREGLLQPGEATGATRARYDESHVRRLQLIRALTEVAGLRLEVVRQVLDDIASADTWHEAVGSAHTRLAEADDASVTTTSRDRVDRFLDRQGWELADASPQRAVLAGALDALDAIDHPVSDDLLNRYADAMRPVAAHEVASVRSPDREASVEAAVVGTLLQEPVLLAVRRIAQENVSRALEG